jgi:Holliday junction resolvase RusA-like endonuclease
MIQFTVYGKSQPAGSKRAMPIYRNGANGRQLVTRANGSPMIAVTDDNPKSCDWKHAVASAAREAYRGALLDGPLSVSFTFYRVRPKGHFGKHGLNKAGRDAEYPTTKPDVLKLARAVEDALTGIVWRDDSQIVDERIAKEWGEPARVEIVVARRGGGSVTQIKELF